MLNSKNKLKRIVINVSLGVFSAMIGFIFLNLYSYRFDFNRLKLLLYYDNSPNLRSVLKPNTSVSIAGVEYKINSMGFRDNEYSFLKSNKNIYRIFCVGDSITFGEGISLKKTYPKLLEKALQEKYSKKIEVINTGVPGYNTYEESWYIKNKLLKLKPDMIILGFFIGNDPEDPSIAFNNKIIIKNKSNLPFVNHFNDQLNKKKLEKSDYWKEYRSLIWDPNGQQWKKCRRSLQGIQYLAQENNIELLVLIIPSYEREEELLFKQLISALEEIGIKYVNAFPELIKTGSIHPRRGVTDNHPDEKMHQAYTQAILAAFNQYSFITKEGDGSR